MAVTRSLTGRAAQVTCTSPTAARMPGTAASGVNGTAAYALPVTGFTQSIRAVGGRELRGGSIVSCIASPGWGGGEGTKAPHNSRDDKDNAMTCSHPSSVSQDTLTLMRLGEAGTEAGTNQHHAQTDNHGDAPVAGTSPPRHNRNDRARKGALTRRVTPRRPPPPPPRGHAKAWPGSPPPQRPPPLSGNTSLTGLAAPPHRHSDAAQPTTSRAAPVHRSPPRPHSPPTRMRRSGRAAPPRRRTARALPTPNHPTQRRAAIGTAAAPGYPPPPEQAFREGHWVGWQYGGAGKETAPPR